MSAELTPGEQTELSPQTLQPHPKNRDLYTKRDNNDLADRIKRDGFDDHQRLVVCTDGTILSGHRRWVVALSLKLDTVPVEVVDVDPDSEEALRILLASNDYREKTPAEKVNEAEMWEDLYNDPDSSDNIDTGVKSRTKATEKAGISEGSYSKAKKVKEKAEDGDPDAQREWDKLETGDQSIHGAYKEVQQAERARKEQEAQESRDEQRKESYESADETVEIRHGDFRDVLADMPEASVDHIVTDPPYDRDALELWAALGAHAARVLNPGGFLIAYSGKAHLPNVHEVLASHLTYHWQAIVRHAGPGAKIFSRKLRTGYKPILIYTKGDPDIQDAFVTDVIEGGGREKGDHDWQQAESEAADLIESFTEIDDRICDPMCGSGTIGVAADRLDRRCLLIDADRDAIETTRNKVIE